MSAANASPPHVIRDREPAGKTWRSFEGKHLHAWFVVGSGNKKKAKSVICQIDGRVWDLYKELLTEPLPDRGESQFQGPDKKLDIGIVTVKGGYNPDLDRKGVEAVTEPYKENCTPTHSRIVIRDDPLTEFLPVVAHELFHSFQYSTDPEGKCILDTKRWAAEATAEWAAHYALPRSDHSSSAGRFLDDPSRSADADREQWYGSYLFFLFLEKHYGGPPLIGTYWDQLGRGGDQFQALNQSLGDQLPDAWAKFAFENYLVAPYDKDSYLNTWGGKPVGRGIKPPAPSSVPIRSVFQVQSQLDPHAATYSALDFPDTNIKRIEIRNNLSEPGARVQALIKRPGADKVWEQPVRLGPKTTFCERLEKVVLIVSNGGSTPLPANALEVETFDAPGPNCRGRQSCQPRTQQDEAGCEAGVLTGTITETVTSRRWDRDVSDDGNTSEFEETVTATLQMRLQPGANEWDEWIDLGSAWTFNGTTSHSSDNYDCHREGSSESSGSGTTEPPSPEELENGVYRTNYVFFGRAPEDSYSEESYSFVMELMEGTENWRSTTSAACPDNWDESGTGTASSESGTVTASWGMSGSSSTFTKDADGRLTINFNFTDSWETSTESYEVTVTGTLTQS